MLDPKTEAVKRATDAIMAAVAKHVAASIAPIIGEAFDAGAAEYAAALQRAMHSMPLALPLASPAPSAEAGTSGKDGRAAPGSVRRAVVAVLKSRAPAGATMAEVINSVPTIDPNVSGLSARNELGRMKDKVYIQDAKGEWRLKPEYLAQLEGSADLES